MAETKTVNLNVETNLGSLKSQLRQAQNEVNELANKFGATSDQAVKAAKKAADLKDAIGDAKALTEAFNPDAKFNALSSSLSGVASGFAAYQGAMGLAGVESKDLEEQLLKVQSAMAVAQGLQGLGEARDSFKQLKAVAVDSFKAIKTAIGSTGIGLLVVALGALYTYWDDIKELVGGVSEEQKKLNVNVEKNVILENEKLDKISEQDNILKLQGKTEKEILKYKIAQIEAVQLATEAQIEQDQITKKNQVAAAQRNYDYLKTFLDFVTFPQKKLTEFFFTFVNQAIGVLNKIPGVDIDKFNVDKILKNFDGVNVKIAKLIFDPTETTNKANEVIKEHKKGLVKLENDKAGLLLQIQNIDKEEVKSNKAKLDKIAEDKKKADEDLKAQILKAQKELDDEINKIAQEQLAKQKTDQLARKEQAKKDEQDIYDNAKGFLQASIIENENNIQAKKDLLEVEKEILLQNTELTQGEIAAIEAKYRADREQLDKDEVAKTKALQEQKIQAVQNGLSTIGNIAELFAGKSRKQQETAFKIQKAANIASTLIDTYLGAQKAYTSQIIPLDPTSVVRGALAAAAVVTAGLLNVKKITSTKFEGGGGGGGGSTPSGGGGGAAPQSVITPNFNIVGNNGTNQLEQLKQAPIQAYVVSGEMSTQQSLDRNRLRNATL